MEPVVKESSSKNFKKSHSRNLEQTDLILDFLSSLDKSKSSFPWQDEINQINADWFRRMDSDSETSDRFRRMDTTSGASDKTSSRHHTMSLSPSKKVTWSEKLTNIKTVAVSPKHTDMYNLSGKQVKNCFSPKSSTENLTSQNSENLYSERLKSSSFNHKTGPKLRLVSVFADNL